ncbi:MULTISPECIES: helix-turn-helix domain-containing protein [Acinetobacter]|uniref:helix-turn-helix domain-containing protein n=1 Tax=Acinetobacter TaxID=469 RepID=UPI0009B71D12|nr:MULTISPECIES: helix-turn-helix transcriptional regulator [Acinetobacter]
MYLEINKIFSLSCQPICNSADRSYLGRIERGEVNLTVDKLYQIAQVLQISPKDLLPD